MRKLLWFLLLVTGQVAFAQKLTIQGRITDKQSGGLPSASVLLLQLKDSTVVNNTLTDTSGRFILPNVDKATYILKVTFVGYRPYVRNIADSSVSDTLQLGLIELQPSAISLAEVSVTGQKEALVVKKDTLEYNAGSFGTRANADVEQLLKKLPGVVVERDGRVRVQGEQVTRIFVDGKEFFEGDLQLATRNLPADAIDKVQVIDGQSEEARFSGVDDGRRDKVINLTLKEDRRNMGFGKVMAGLGTSNRYMAAGNYNRFTKGNQFSIVGRSNNVNNQGLSSDGLDAGGSGQNGLVKTYMGGATMSKQITKTTRINGSYRVNHKDATTLTDLSRQNFLPEGKALYFERSRHQNTTNAHSGTIGLEHNSPANTIKLNTFLNSSDANSQGQSSRQSYSVAGTLVNQGARTSRVRNESMSLQGNLFYGHRFRRTGRLFTVTSQISSSQVEALGRSESLTQFRDGSQEDLRQRNDQENDNLNFGVRVVFTEPIGKKQYLQANYNFTNRASESDLAVYDIINENPLFNEQQSNRFKSDFLYQQAGLTYRLTGNKVNLSFGSQTQQSTLSRRIESEDFRAVRSFFNLLPSLDLKVELSRSARLSFIYGTSVREPSINQLLPVLSRYDPLQLYIGNPNLRPQYSHNGRLSFNAFVSKTGFSLSSSASFNHTNNPITAAVSIDERQVRTIQYVNVGQSQNFSALLDVSIPIKNLSSRINLGPYLNQGRSLNLLNGTTGTIIQQSLGGNINYSFNYKDDIDFNLRANIAAVNAKYALNKGQNQFFVNSDYMADATISFLNAFDFSAEFNYSRFKNARTNFDQAIPILNFSLSRTFLKAERGMLRLSAVNALNRNVGISQIATLNYIDQATRNTLGSYYILSALYRIRNTKKK